MTFNVAIVYIEGSDCRIHCWYMIKDDAMKVMKTSSLNKKVSCYIFLHYIKLSEETTYYKKTAAMSNRAKEHYKNNKEVLIEHARNKYRELSQKDKEIKKRYGRARYRNMPEEKRKDQNNIKKLL